MSEHADTTGRRFIDPNDDKVDYNDDEDGLSELYDDYAYDHSNEKAEEDEEGFPQHHYEEEDDGEGQVLSSVYEDQAHDGRCAGAESEDGQDAGIKISQKDEHRLLGAFLLAVDGGLGESGGGTEGGGRCDEPQLPTNAPACLKKFTTIAASLGLKTTREKLREDFEKVVRSNGLVDISPGDPWLGADDAERPVVGFTYKVFRRYYLAKIQGELLEVNIRQAWEDLHQGTGGKLMPSGASPIGFDATGASAEMSGGGDGGQHYRHHQQRGDSDISGGDSRGRPYVARAELQKILTREGEALTDEEVDELLRECRPD
ncbi:unnamed protein product, partial [Ectocarpus sp. 12 AP-2014]